MSEVTQSGPTPLYVEEQARFDALARGLLRAPLLAVDTEAASFHRYLDRIYLVQVSSREQTAVVDPLAVQDLTLLGTALADPAIEIVFHDADYDLRILDRDYGFRATNLFDTRIAAQLLNEPSIGLAALLEKYAGVRLDKRFQRTDWSLRPLAPGMLAYAAADTHYLPSLRDVMRGRLVQMGRMSWAEEEFKLLERVRWNSTAPRDEAYLRIKGARSLKGRQLAVLRELVGWREATAKQLDRASFRVVNNEVLLAVARAMPRTLEALRATADVPAEIARRRGADLLAAVDRGLSAGADTIPVFERTRRPAPEPDFDALLERLKAARNAVAARVDLAPGFACPNGILESIARRRPRTLAEMEEVPEMRRWQIEVFGPELLKAMSS